MLNEQQKDAITELVKSNLDRAESTWKLVGKEIALAEATTDSSYIKKSETLPSKIPGHEWVSDAFPVVDEYVALVADMRGSTQHLLCEISHKVAKVSLLQRVYYETSALLPALAKTIQYQEGKVTEYLGDGILALFLIEEEKKEESIRLAYKAALNCLQDTRTIVNSELKSRYSLPDLNVGIGMALSKAIVTLVGLDGEKHPKAIGECVYRATKLSGGTNQICVDERSYADWPKSKGGKLQFVHKTFGEVKGYQISLES